LHRATAVVKEILQIETDFSGHGDPSTGLIAVNCDPGIVFVRKLLYPSITFPIGGNGGRMTVGQRI
jgi:hypothetical protein